MKDLNICEILCYLYKNWIQQSIWRYGWIDNTNNNQIIFRDEDSQFIEPEE